MKTVSTMCANNNSWTIQCMWAGKARTRSHNIPNRGKKIAMCKPLNLHMFNLDEWSVFKWLAHVLIYMFHWFCCVLSLSLSLYVCGFVFYHFDVNQIRPFEVVRSRCRLTLSFCCCRFFFFFGKTLLFFLLCLSVVAFIGFFFIQSIQIHGVIVRIHRANMCVFFFFHCASAFIGLYFCPMAND